MDFYYGLGIGIIAGFVIGIVFAGIVLIHSDRQKKRLERDGIQAGGK